jgi:ABC-type transport system involved in cytochrome c biogenesis permease component
LAALVSYPMIYLLFGREHAGAAAIASILIVQYPVLAAYIPAIVGMTHLGTRRWQIVLPLILLAVKIAFLPLAYVSPLLLALGAPMAHAAGGMYVYSRLRSLRNASGTTAHGGGDAE